MASGSLTICKSSKADRAAIGESTAVKGRDTPVLPAQSPNLMHDQSMISFESPSAFGLIVIQQLALIIMGSRVVVQVFLNFVPQCVVLQPKGSP